MSNYVVHEFCLNFDSEAQEIREENVFQQQLEEEPGLNQVLLRVGKETSKSGFLKGIISVLLISTSAMIVTRIEEIIGTERDARGDAWASRRFLTAMDNVGFTLTETTVEAGADLTLWYKHHIEANYVIEGEGEVENAETGEIYPLAPGTTYTLDKNDKHHLRAFSRLKLVCVFNPALTGNEVHDEDGAYTLPE